MTIKLKERNLIKKPKVQRNQLKAEAVKEAAQERLLEMKLPKLQFKRPIKKFMIKLQLIIKTRELPIAPKLCLSLSFRNEIVWLMILRELF